MGKTQDVDKARRILPTNAAPGVAELNSNFTTIIASVNPETAGEDCTPVECGSVAEVAANFKPKVDLEIKKLDKLGADKVEESTASITMNYGEDPSQIMDDFGAENIAVKAKSSEGERVLLDQQLSYLALEDLQERLKDQKVAQLFQNNKEALIQTLEAEIERMKKLIEDVKLESLGGD
ncbi:MAG: hypothetical protein QME58_13680 [Bacteroidota bacterium]|nr:hypothetical protein [Bacteroidota bacterium]